MCNVSSDLLCLDEEECSNFSKVLYSSLKYGGFHAVMVILCLNQNCNQGNKLELPENRNKIKFGIIQLTEQKHNDFKYNIRNIAKNKKSHLFSV